MYRVCGSILRGAMLAALVPALLIGHQPARAQTEAVLYSFGSQSTDGVNPYAGLSLDKLGNLYGTTYQGAYAWGTVFKISPSDAETVLYSFKGGFSDGAQPTAGVLMSNNGNLYGTTNVGGASDWGTVYKITPSGKETILYSFCQSGYCVDGGYPTGTVIRDNKGNLYGTTYWGGAYAQGAVFKLSPKGKETVLHSFCQGGYPCSDGGNPEAGLIIDKLGNLYGTTIYGGANGYGAVFKISSSGDETVLYSFCQAGYPCADGANPYAGLIMDKKGNLYGTTQYGGANVCGGNGCGTVFRLSPSGAQTVLYSFGSQAGDGVFPQGDLISDKTGNLYGTTSTGSPNSNGTVFKLTPTGTETTLYTFCSQPNCADGAGSTAGVTMDKLGNLYGTTQYGGAYGNGVVFKVTP